MPGEGRGLSSRPTQDVVRDLEIGQPSNPKKCQKMQMALHAKAKAEAAYRFYALNDKINRADILAHAYAQCRSNKNLPLRRQGAHRAWTARTSRTSKRVGLSGGWPNWRWRSGGRHTDRSRSDVCSYRRPTANSGPWASRPCEIGSA